METDIHIQAVISADQMKQDLLRKLDRMADQLQEVEISEGEPVFMFRCQFDGTQINNVWGPKALVALAMRDALEFIAPRLVASSSVRFELHASGWRNLDPLQSRASNR